METVKSELNHRSSSAARLASVRDFVEMSSQRFAHFWEQMREAYVNHVNRFWRVLLSILVILSLLAPSPTTTTLFHRHHLSSWLFLTVL